MQFPAKIMLVLGLFVAVISEFVTMTMMVVGTICCFVNNK